LKQETKNLTKYVITGVTVGCLYVGLIVWVFYRALFDPLCHVHDDDWMIDEK